MYKLLVSYRSSPNHFEDITDMCRLADGTIVAMDTQGPESCDFELQEAQDIKNRLKEYPDVAYVRMEEVK